MSDPGLEERLSDWFAAEVRRAADDRRAPASDVVAVTPRARRPAARASVPIGIATIAVVATVALLGALTIDGSRPAATPGSPAPATPTPAVATPAVATDRLALASDGLPTEIAGVPVLRVDAARRELAAAVDDREITVGGWYRGATRHCQAIAPDAPGYASPELLPPCGPDSITSDPAHTAGLEVWYPDGIRPYDGPIVVRLHTNDHLAPQCLAQLRSQCAISVLVDEVVWRPAVPVIVHRYPDGIPSEIAGETVFRRTDVALFRNEKGSFLLGGWSLGSGLESCAPTALPSSAGNAPCNDNVTRLGDTPAAPAPPYLVGDLPRGPVVVRARYAPTSCPPDARCGIPLADVTVEDLVWSGDEVTRASPLRAVDVASALMTVNPDLQLRMPLRDDGTLETGACDPGFPRGTWRTFGARGIDFVLVFPSVEEREAFGRNVGPTSFRGRGCATMTDGSVARHWISVENAMVEVDVNADGETADQRVLVANVEAALRGIPN